MANLKEIVEGAIDDIAQETIDENTYYNIDMADGGITNAQMASAIAHPEFFNDGDVYQCLDSGTYTEKHFYKFNGTTWVDVTLEWGYPMLTGASDPTTATEGLVNQLYRNTTSNALFVCTAVTSGTPNTYTWTAVGGGSTMYLHNIYCIAGVITLVSNMSTAYTPSSLAQFLYTAGYNSLSNVYIGYDNANVTALGIFSENGTTLKYKYNNSTFLNIDNVSYRMYKTEQTSIISSFYSATVTEL